MRLISNKALRDFATRQREADEPLQAWRNFVFNIAGNRYRLIAAIHFNTQTLYVRAVMTHAEYDYWRP